MLRYIGAVIALILVVGVVAIAREIWTAHQAEQNLHAVLCVADTIEAYVNQKGEWPRSWEELASLEPAPKTRGFYDFTKDLSELKSRVHVRFDADETMLRNPRASGLIEPAGPCYGYLFRLDDFFASIERHYK